MIAGVDFLLPQVSHEQLAILESRSEAEEKQLQDGVKLSQERSLNQQEVEGRSSGRTCRL